MKKIIISFLIILSAMGSAFAGNIPVRGKVTDAKTSQPLVGAMIIVPGTGKGVISGADGGFTLEVDADGQFEVSYLGYKTVTESVQNRSSITIALENDSSILEEVVVLGYGQAQRKSDLSVAVSQKQIGTDIKSRSTDIVGALQGQIAGVTISNNGGDPMSKPTVVIRGQGSRINDALLYVVDGVAGVPFNAEDVESITVLKDAASAAIYGTNVGSGGVILVTTKKAKAGAIRVTARASTGFQSAYRKPQVLNAEEYVKVMSDAYAANGKAIPGGIDPAIYPYGQTTRTNWIDEIFRTGLLQRYSLSVSGGSETIKAYVSAEYGKTEGTLLNTRNEVFGAKGTIDFQVKPWLSLSQRVNFKYTNGQGGINNFGHTGVITAAMFMPPSASVYDEDKDGNVILDENGNKKFGGVVPSWAKDAGVAGTFGEVQNPVATLKRLNQSRPNQSIYSTTGLTVRPLDGFKITSDLTAGSDNNRYEDFKMKIPEIGKTNNENSRTLEYSRSTTFLWESVASYDNTFGKHSVSAMVGYSMKYNRYNSLWASMVNFPSEDEQNQHFVNGEPGKDKPREEKTEESATSVFARASWSYGQRYFLTGSIRRDATSKLYKSNNSGIFPGVSAAWKISSEPFFPNNRAVSLLKLRASWGQIGNVAGVPNYSSSNNLSLSGKPVYLGDNHQNQIQGLGLTGRVNLGLGWETSEMMNYGLDLGLLNGHISFSTDYFIKTTKDLVEKMPLPSVAGVKEQPYANVGKVVNKGFEFVLGYKDQTASGWSFGADANVSFLSSEVKDLGGAGDYYIQHDTDIRRMTPLRSAVGQPWYSYYVIESAGIFQTQEEIDAYTFEGKKIQPNAMPGDMKFVDRNNDGIINELDAKYMGSYTPKVTYGLTANVEYKGIDLSVTLQGAAGHKIFNGTKVMTYEGTQGWNLSKDVLDSWTYDKTSSIPRITSGDSNRNFTTMSDFFLEKGDYLRVKSITLGYTLPRKLFGMANKTTDIRIYATGENLFTFTKYSGMDPEVGNHGLDGGTYPVSRVISFGVNMSF